MLAGRVKAEAGISVLFVMSHLASADDVDSAQNASQLAEMQAVAEAFPQFDLCFSIPAASFSGGLITVCLPAPALRLWRARPLPAGKSDGTRRQP